MYVLSNIQIHCMSQFCRSVIKCLVKTTYWIRQIFVKHNSRGYNPELFVPVHFGCGKNSINMGDRDRKRKNVREREIERAQVLWF